MLSKLFLNIITRERTILRNVYLVNILFLLMFFSPPSFSVEFNSNNQPLDLTPHIKFLVDDMRLLTIEDVVSSSIQKQFIQANISNISQGFTSSAIWVQVPISTSSEKQVLLELDHALIDNVELYKINSAGEYEKSLYGDTYPFKQRDFKFRNFIINLGVINKSPQTIYFRLTSSISSVKFPLKLWTYEGLSHYLEKVQTIQGVYFGMMLLMPIISALLFVILKELIFLYYFGYLISFQIVISSLNGFAYQYIWPDSPFLQANLPVVFLSLTGIFGLIFSKKFLNIKLLSNRLNHLFNLNIATYTFAILPLLFISPGLAIKTASTSGLFAALVILYAGILGVINKQKGAWYFTIGISFFLIGSIAFYLHHAIGLLPDTFFTRYAMQIGSLGEVFFLAIAIGMKIFGIQQRQTVEITKANDALSSLNETLEAKVEKRTNELKKLNHKLKDLADRDGMTGLLNHRALIEELDKRYSGSMRHDYKISVAMIDVDNFKMINDEFGHPAGDKVLIEIAKIISSYIRGDDVIGRYGGEEFLLLSSFTDTENELEIYNRIVHEMSKIELEVINHKTITISIGAISGYAKHFERASLMIAKADQALYKAKDNGRNQLVFNGSA